MSGCGLISQDSIDALNICIAYASQDRGARPFLLFFYLFLFVLCAKQLPCLPLHASRKVVRQLAENDGWKIGWVFDGHNLYAPKMFLPQHETNYRACMQPSAPCPCTYALLSMQLSLVTTEQVVCLPLISSGMLAVTSHNRGWVCLKHVAETAPYAVFK